MADFPISGNIDPQTFPFLLTDLHRNGATGSLKVEGPTYQKALYFRSGRVLFGSSNDPRDQLGAILIENGRITPEQLEDVNAKVGPGRPLAKVLSESGLVSQQELSEAAQIKVERILWDIITYTGGSFEFEDGVLPKGAVDLKLSTERLILAAVRRVTDRSFVLRHLGSLEIVLRPTSELAARLHEVQSDAGGLAEQIDGTRTLREAAGLTRLDEFEAAKVACGLLILALVEKSGDVPVVAADEEASPFIVPDPEPGEEPSIDLAETARDSMATTAPKDSAMDSPFFVPEGFSPPPVTAAAPIPIEAEPEPEPEPVPEPEPETVVLDSPPPLFATPDPPPMAKPASSPGMLPLIPPPPRKPEPEQWSPPPPEPEPETIVEEEEQASPVPPSKEDLAALDALLNPRSIAHPPAEPMDRTGGWEPRFSPGLVGGGRRQAEGRGLKGALIGLAGLVVLASVGAAFYVYYWLPQQQAAAVQTPAPPVRTAAPTTASPVAGGTASPATAPATAAPATTAPATATAKATATSKPATATAAPTRTTAPTQAPTVPPATGGAGGLAEARALLRAGQYGPAAGAFAAHLRRHGTGFTIQLLVACSDETVKKAVTSVGQDELYVVPVDYKGRSCYKLGWGLYDGEPRAAAALKSLPDYFRQPGVTPRVVPTSTVLR